MINLTVSQLVSKFCSSWKKHNVGPHSGKVFMYLVNDIVANRLNGELIAFDEGERFLISWVSCER